MTATPINYADCITRLDLDKIREPKNVTCFVVRLYWKLSAIGPCDLEWLERESQWYLRRIGPAEKFTFLVAELFSTPEILVTICNLVQQDLNDRLASKAALQS